MQLLISDANILIDMEEGGLLEAMFSLPYQFATPDILFVEELEEAHSHLLELGLELKEILPVSMMYAMQLTTKYRKASRNDCFALALGYEKLQLIRILLDIDMVENSVIKKFINETYHIENEFIFQLDPTRFDLIPEYVVNECDKILEEFSEVSSNG